VIADKIICYFLDIAFYLVNLLPDTSKFIIPEDVKAGLAKLLQFVGWLMPFSYYQPLLLFIVGFTMFRITNAVIKRVRRG